MEGGRKGGREEQTFCSATLPHKPTITQASGLQFNIKARFAPLCEGGSNLKKAEVGHKVVHLLLFYMCQKPFKTLS